jgi:hypothetical protein
MDRLSDGLNAIESANSSLEARASKIVSGSTGAIAAIAGVASIPAQAWEVSGPFAAVIAALCGSVLVMFWFAARLWGPAPACVPVGHDVAVLYADYIAESEDVAFNNALIDSSKAFEHAKWVNEIKGREIRHMLIVLQVQVVLLGAAVITRAFG